VTLIGELLSPIYPFIIALKDLLEWIKTTKQAHDVVRVNTKRLENVLVKFAKEEGSEMVWAILRDIAKKVGLDEALEIAEKLLKNYKGEKSADAIALSYVRENSNEPVESYVKVLQSLLQEFGDRNFVLIFDRFETVRKSTVDFLINFINLLNYRSAKFHIVLSFRTEEETWNDMVANHLYKYASKQLNELNAKQLNLTGVSEQSLLLA